MKLPDPKVLRKLCQSIAMLDAILMQEWELRYYSYNSRWSHPDEMASMRNGSGDHYFILFAPNGCVTKGFWREAKTARRGIPREKFYQGFPPAFRDTFLNEPAFITNEVSVVAWRLAVDRNWTWRLAGAKDCESGSDALFAVLTGGPRAYQAWASDYYEREVPTSVVDAVYQHTPITESLLSNIAPSINRAQLAEDLKEIAYPSMLKD